MRKQGIGRISSFLMCIVILLLARPPLIASDPPDSEINPENGNIETTDSVWMADNFQVRHVIYLNEQNARLTSNVTADQRHDNGPRIAITDEGDTWIVWWRDSESDQVLLRQRIYSDGEWLDEMVVSRRGESSRNPEIVWDGANPWIVYELDDPDGKSIGVQAIHDDPNPVPGRMILGTTDFAEDLDTLIHHVADHLWVTWIDSLAYVAWAEYDKGTENWGVMEYEDYANDGVDAARGRIREAILGQ